MYPISLKLQDRPCLVVGGGIVAERKVLSLLTAQAKILVVSPKLTVRLKTLVEKGAIKHLSRGYCSEDLKGVDLVICATNDEELNHRVAFDCKKERLLINVVDNPELSTFFLPAVLRRGDLSIAVSTKGKSPLLARKIKEELATHYGPEFAELVDLLGEARIELMKGCPAQQKRKKILEEMLDLDLLDIIKRGEQRRLKEWIARCISSQ